MRRGLRGESDGSRLFNVASQEKGSDELDESDKKKTCRLSCFAKQEKKTKLNGKRKQNKSQHM